MSGPAQQLVDASWRLRGRLGPRGRHAARRVVDPIAAPTFGSIHHVTTDRPHVALTLDDGPDGQWTAPILDVLARHGAGATFFMLVEAAEARPDLVHRVVAEGHEIGLHGLDHTPLTDLHGPVEVVVRDARRRLEAVAGRPVRWFRPPFGSQNLRTYRAVRRAGLDVVVWGPEGADWDEPEAERVAAKLTRTCTAGAVVLLHDGMCPPPPDTHPAAHADRAATVEATIRSLAAVGLGTATLGDVVASGRIRRSAWFRPSPG